MSTTPNLNIEELFTGQAQKEISINTAIRELESTLAGQLSKSVAGSANVNLTRTEALNAYYKFTGALTGNIEVRYPASGGAPRLLSVHNATSGAFTLTLTVAGGTGVTITQGERRQFAIDGSSVVALNTGTIGTYTAVSAQAVWAAIFHSAAQSIANATATALAFNSERADTDTMHDTVTNNSRLTATTAGVYLISANIEWAANATGYREVFFQVSGAARVWDDLKLPITGGTVTRQSISTSYALTAGQYVEVLVNQTSGGALNVNTNANHSPEFRMVRLGGA